MIKQPGVNSYQKVSDNGKTAVYKKWNPTLRLMSTLTMTVCDHDSEKRDIHVRHEQPQEDIQAILDMNVARQNEGRGHKGDGLHQVSCIPVSIYQQIMKDCGHQPGHGHDEKRFKRILNDPDYRKLKTVSGRV